jgi:hypothetical protein
MKELSAFTMQVFFKTGEVERIAILDHTWEGATAKAHMNLVGRGEYSIQHGDCGILIN